MDLPAWKAVTWAAFHAHALTRTWRDVLLTLATFRGRGGALWPAHATLAERAGCSVRTVRTALAAARDAGLVTWESGARARTSNRYRLLVPAVVAPARLVGKRCRGGENKIQRGYREVQAARRPEPSWEERRAAQAALVAIAARRRAAREASVEAGRRANSSYQTLAVFFKNTAYQLA